MVIGKFTLEDWVTLVNLRNTIRELKKLSNPLVSNEIAREEHLYNYILGLYKNCA